MSNDENADNFNIRATNNSSKDENKDNNSVAAIHLDEGVANVISNHNFYDNTICHSEDKHNKSLDALIETADSFAEDVINMFHCNEKSTLEIKNEQLQCQNNML